MNPSIFGIFNKKLKLTLAALLLLFTLAGCGFIHYGDTGRGDPNRNSLVTAPLVAEFVTQGGSKLTFTGDGDYGVNNFNDWSWGIALVEFASDAEFLLEGRENNAAYRYSFTFFEFSANYDVADGFELYDGDKSFARCSLDFGSHSSPGDVPRGLYTKDPAGERLEFERVTVPGEGGE